jgi:hypothetical protein
MVMHETELDPEFAAIAEYFHRLAAAAARKKFGLAG